MKKVIDLIAGARPNFVKIAAITSAIIEEQKKGSALSFRLVHTGQHYDAAMSGSFFSQLGIPEPDINLGVGSGSQSEQTARIMLRYESLLRENKPDLCLVVGDVTSTMACAITAKKNGVKVAHVEAGIRSGDHNMPEEINRLVTDSISDYFFTTTEATKTKLINNGSVEGNVFFVGNTMIDTLYANEDKHKRPSFFDSLGLKKGNYLVLTLHRPSNVDEVDVYYSMLKTIAKACGAIKIIYPVHPRTKKSISDISGLPNNIYLVSPQPYLEFNYLVKNSLGVATDSGGITEETTVMGIPCITLRDSTERPETITIGTNELVGTDLSRVKEALGRMVSGEWKKGRIPEKWDGLAGRRIVEALNLLL